MTPGEQLIELLEQLRQRLNNSGVERTVGLKENLGQDCSYFKKSMQKFLREDYMDIRNISNQISNLIKVIENE